MRLASISLLVALLAPAVSLAQEARATLIGRVTDSLGAVMAGVKVQVANVGTGANFSSVTNQSGSYEIPYLLPGVYRVAVEMPGFRKAVRDGIELRVNDRVPLDFTLQVGDVAESVTVSAEAPLLESTSASVGMTMDARRITEFPVVGGNPFYLARLSPGVLSAGGRSASNPMDAGAATSGIIVNGTRSGSSEATVDGAPNMTNRSQSFSPPQDLVQEFRIQTATFDATIGHAAGALTNVSMKSGTNTLHGTAFFNDSHIRAVPWFTNRFIYDPNTGPITPEKAARAHQGWIHQRWGPTLTGPVRIPKLYDGRNKSFWTFGYEGLYIQRNLGLTATIPTLAQRRGDFSELLRLGPRYQIYDPASIAPAPMGRFSRQILTGNLIPQSRIDPVAKNILSFWPEPNQPGTSDGRDNYFRTRDVFRRNRTLTSRIDHNFSEDNRLFFRWNNTQHYNEDDTLPGIISGNLLDLTAWGAALDDVYVFNPQFLVNVRYSITYQNDLNTRRSQGFDLVSLGFAPKLVQEIATKVNPAGITFPEVAIESGAYNGAGGNGGSDAATAYQTVSGIVTRLYQNHSFRFGAEYRLERESNYAFGNVSPRLEFGPAWTLGPLDTSAAAPIGQGLASMVLGVPTGGRVNNNASFAQQSAYSSLFLQDDWRITPKLTMNIGLRYEYESPTTERFNRTIRDFDFESASPISPQVLANYSRSPILEVPPSAFRTLGGLRFAGDRGQPRGLWRGDRNNFAPRIGLAYQTSTRTVLRAGYGIFYDIVGVDRTNVNQGGFSQTTNLIPSLDNGLSFRPLSNPFPDGVETPPGAAQGLGTFLGRNVSFFFGRPLNPYMQRWSLSVQRELPLRSVLEVAYVGNRGNKLSAERQLNPVPRQYLSASPVRDQQVIDFLAQQVPSPFFGLPEFTGTTLGNVRVRRDQLLRPYPHFTDISVNMPIGYSYYHSLQVRFEKRMSHGITFQSSWTWSKFMEAATFLNPTDLAPEKVISEEDYPHRFVLNAIWEVPVGRGRALWSGAGGLANLLAGGWQFQGWYEGQSGNSLGFANSIFTGNLQDIPLPVGQRRADQWFNVDAGFDRDNRRQLANNIRTLSSRFTGVRADGINNFDLSMFKNTRVRERFIVQFKMECYNVLNHVQFAAPNTNPVNTAFATITAERGHGQRQLTFGIKLLF